MGLGSTFAFVEATRSTTITSFPAELLLLAELALWVPPEKGPHKSLLPSPGLLVESGSLPELMDYCTFAKSMFDKYPHAKWIADNMTVSVWGCQSVLRVEFVFICFVG